MYAFEFARPETLGEALALLEDEDAQVLAGGQTLIPTLKSRLASPSTLVSLGQIAELKGVCEDEGGQLSIGAMTTHEEVATGAASRYPGLAALAGQIGDPAVRHRGTLGGSLANNDPSACYPAAVLASEAVICTNSREIPASGFFDGLFGTVLEEGELITHVRFPVPQAATYVKIPQPASRFALTGVFLARFGPEDVRVAVTGASEDGVFRWEAAEAALAAEFTLGALADLSVAADEMISDVHGSGAYRAHLVRVATERAVAALA